MGIDIHSRVKPPAPQNPSQPLGFPLLRPLHRHDLLHTAGQRGAALLQPALALLRHLLAQGLMHKGLTLQGPKRPLKQVQLLGQKALFRLLVAGVVRLHLQDHTGRFVAGCQ